MQQTDPGCDHQGILVASPFTYISGLAKVMSSRINAL